VLRNDPAKAKVISTDANDRISSQIANELESGARLRLKPQNAESTKDRITHRLRGTSRAKVKGVNDAAA
jgi:antirestriction protein ArdC